MISKFVRFTSHARNGTIVIIFALIVAIGLVVAAAALELLEDGPLPTIDNESPIVLNPGDQDNVDHAGIGHADLDNDPDAGIDHASGSSGNGGTEGPAAGGPAGTDGQHGHNGQPNNSKEDGDGAESGEGTNGGSSEPGEPGDSGGSGGSGGQTEGGTNAEQGGNAGANPGTGQTELPAGTIPVALTFDDGPDHKYTEQVLDILDEYGIKATFFLVGIQIDKYPDVVERIIAEGHEIGNHTDKHGNLSKLTPEEGQQQLDDAAGKIAAITGEDPILVRAPYGAVRPGLKEELEAAGKRLVAWTVDTRDWAGVSSEDIVNEVKENIKPGGIVLLHSFGGKGGNLDNTIEALPQIIEYLLDNGYQPATVSEVYAAKEAERG